jgi:hypothetical protein
VTRTFPADLEALGEKLAASSGLALRNVLHDPAVTCATCAVPVAGYALCPACLSQRRSGLPLADRVASLVYAVKPDSRAYRVVLGYKAARPGPGNVDAMRALLTLGLRAHGACLMDVAGGGGMGWAVVPSTRGSGTLVDLVRGLARRPEAELPVACADPTAGRSVQPQRWALPPMARVPDHVLLIDDSWVSGGHAQSLAAAFKLAGVPQVSVFTVARVLDPAWAPTSGFVRGRLDGAVFDWRRCPWTAASCPGGAVPAGRAHVPRRLAEPRPDPSPGAPASTSPRTTTRGR